jgi:acid phosphatase
MRRVAGILIGCLILTGCSPGRTASSASPSGPASAVSPASPAQPASPGSASAAPPTTGVPRPEHIVVAVFENHGYDQVIGNGQAPYLNGLAAQGALLTDAHGVTHPSQPNYLALFAGSTSGVRDDSCPRDLAGTANLGSQLAAAGLSFAGYSEGMPSTGYRGCGGGDGYARKHNAWVDFTALPSSVNRTFAEFPSAFASLPTVSFVVPNLCHDMHDCSVSTGDAWARANLDPYVRWAAGHNSLLIVTWDEDENTSGGSAGGGHIPTMLVGAPVTAGARYGGSVDHYRMLRTIEAAYGLPGLGTAGSRQPVTGIWR